MIIVIDIGNSNVDLSGIRAGVVEFTGEIATRREWGTAEYTAALAPLLEGVACRGAIVSSVVPQVTQAVRDAAGALLGVAPLVVTEQTKTGLTLDLPEKERVGRDRLVDAAWAAAHYPLPAVTADLGTATTLNVILPGGVFAGGIICAGIQTSPARSGGPPPWWTAWWPPSRPSWAPPSPSCSPAAAENTSPPT